ncbi:hypothetical protein RF11_04654 [Thelohanellus kitauei]|uniref:Uncharacterized protein n=1 Tax=Thelohanellus kitauei TaxID=669202 RepID=A0A0C2I964_THEKT|nr:hypothetical protein RF11_04654 [Thelohanellus kitauei]
MLTKFNKQNNVIKCKQKQDDSQSLINEVFMAAITRGRKIENGAGIKLSDKLTRLYMKTTGNEKNTYKLHPRINRHVKFWDISSSIVSGNTIVKNLLFLILMHELKI